ncbi:MAG: EutP/PduV family microcompartment system protein [Bacillota bacterium]|nr:EutP/PduV family microcompartment system protein [Bacillota bacterium]
MKKRIMVVGPVGCGKSTLIKALYQGNKVKKTQSLEFEANSIDTPGEFVENPFYHHCLFATALEADLVLFLQDATKDQMLFPPGFATGFPKPSIGVITKIDEAEANTERAANILKTLDTTEKVFIPVSSYTGDGLTELTTYIEDFFHQ